MASSKTIRLSTIVLSAFLWLSAGGLDAGADDLKLLFMGDNGHHQPSRRFQELAPALKKRGVELKYTDDMSDINSKTLAEYDGLVLYANIDRIEDDQAQALLDYVASGKGFVPIHCATFCWRNNREIVALMGGQFQRHGGQVFTTEVVASDHPVMKGYGSFTSWDETYIHHLHNEKNRTVLEYRVEGEQAQGKSREPWTWVRNHGKGRVFYTAWGHDKRTFKQPGFHNLIERGIRWACSDDPGKVPGFTDPDRFPIPRMTKLRTDVEKFDYVDVGPKIPNYTPGESWGTQGKPRNLMQKPLSPEESVKHFVTPEGLKVKPYADERSFESKPIAMTWDERGRLWICETLDYPNELGIGRDRIRICEDTDGDHVADKFTVFAEGLSIPTAITIFRGGAIVHNATETLYLKDLDGDDVADQKITLITGWSSGDTHGGVSNFRYGLDNWIWAMQGYNDSRPRYEGKGDQRFRQGFWRFKLSQTDPPKVTDLEFVRSSNNNTWGLGISEEGLIFGSTANGNPSMFMSIPNRYYESVRGWAPTVLDSAADTYKYKPIVDDIRQVDWHGGYTAAAGHALYTARAFPSHWWNKTAFVCGPTGHLIGTFVLRRDGADYTSSSPVNLLASDDDWSAPIMAEVGPDGAVWVLDWYNFIVQHNPTPNGFKRGKGNAYESELRDKRRGRIYRIVAEKAGDEQLHAYQSLATANTKELVATLTHPSFPWRLQAQRILIERRAEDAVEELLALLSNKKVDEIGLNPGAIHALWTLDGLGCDFKDQATLSGLKSALEHPSAGVRRNALAVLPKNEAGLEMLMRHADLLNDVDVQVRLQAVLSLSEMPASSQAGMALAKIANSDGDDVMLDGLTAAGAAHAVPFLKSLLGSAQESSKSQQKIADVVSRHVARGRPEADDLKAIVSALPKAEPGLANVILDGLAEGLPKDFELSTNSSLDQAFSKAFDEVESKVKVKLIRLAGNCGSSALKAAAAEVIAEMMVTISDENAAEDTRVAAASNLINFQANDEEAVRKIVGLINPQISPEFAGKLFSAVEKSESDSAASVFLEAMPRLTPQTKASAIAAMLSKPAWVKTLVGAMADGKFDLNELSLEQKQALRSFPDKSIRKIAEELLARGGGLPDADRDKVLQSLMHLTEKSGDVDAGLVVYKKVCANCHVHGDIGQKIGPELTGMSVHPKEELLTHIIDPSRSVEGNYRLYNVLTIDGKVINGMLAGESRTSITIIDSQANKIDLAREDIEELAASRKSVMPEGFEKQISESELTDLLEFLTNKGKFAPIQLDKYNTVVSTRPLFGGGEGGPDQMIFSDWKPKMFKGVPFLLTDPKGGKVPNMIMLYGPRTDIPRDMPKSVKLPCNSMAKAIHFLSGVGGWSHPYDSTKSVAMIVRLHFADGTKEDHELLNAVHFADYIRRVDVPKSEFAFKLRDQQMRYLAVKPRKPAKINSIELIKGEKDKSVPMVMAITVER